MTERNGGSDSLRGSRASGMPRAPEITILDSAFWWEIDQAAHCCGRCEGFTPVDGCFKGCILGVIRLKCLSVATMCTARIPPQNPVTSPNHPALLCFRSFEDAADMCIYNWGIWWNVQLEGSARRRRRRGTEKRSFLAVTSKRLLADGKSELLEYLSIQSLHCKK